MDYIPLDKLKKNKQYGLFYKGNYKEIGVFVHVGQTGIPIFHPIDDSSFQDWFGLKEYGVDWAAKEEESNK